MSASNEERHIPGAEIAGWPTLNIQYPTDPSRIAALLPPGIEPSAASNVYLSIYLVAVPDEPEFGILTNVDADYRGETGRYTIGYGIDQESAIFQSKNRDGQPKYPAETEYYRWGRKVSARCSHQRYTFVEYKGQTTGSASQPLGEHTNIEWWVKVSPAVGGAEKAYDFAPHAVKVETTQRATWREDVSGELRLLESPWDPIAELLPVVGEVQAELVTNTIVSRNITLEGALDPDAFWPHLDTIGSSRWPGTLGGPRREMPDLSTMFEVQD